MKNRIQKHTFLFHLSEESIKGIIQTDAFLFPFSEGNKKGILNDAFLFHLSGESVKGIRNDKFLFPFMWQEIGFACNLQVALFRATELYASIR